MCTTTATTTFELARSIEAPGRARALVGVHLCPEHGQEALPAAQLVATELTTCAVLYGSSPLFLQLDCAVTALRIEVTHGIPPGVRAEDLPIDEEGGLRSALLGKLARSWGIAATPEAGRLLWCLLPTGHVPAEPVGLSWPQGRGLS